MIIDTEIIETDVLIANIGIKKIRRISAPASPLTLWIVALMNAAIRINTNTSGSFPTSSMIACHIFLNNQN